MQQQTVHILLVEDDAVDREAIQRAFKKQKIANPLLTAKDGIEALAMLRHEAGFEPVPAPNLILLDLNMPRMSGIEFLDQVRSDPRLSQSIIFVLTTSDDDADKLAAYKQHVAGYLVKAKVGEDFLDVIKFLDHYWRVVEFPPAQPL